MISFFLGFFFLSISLVQAADSQNLESAKSSQIQLEAKTVEVKPSEPKADSSVLKIETGSAKLNLLLQTWYIDDSTATAAKNTFRARRAEIKMSGNLNADSRWFVMIDPAKSLKAGPVASNNDNKILQDFGGTIQPLPGFELTAGQMKIPTIAESLDPSSDLPLPERSILARTYGDKRQLGLQASYKEVKWKITSMYSNGGSANTDDTTTAKDVFVRVEFNPFSGLSFGGWVGANDFIFSDNGKWGLNFRWKGESEMARFELAHSDDTVSGAKKKSDGYVAEVGYSVMSQLQPVLRFERFFSDSSNTDGAKAITLGFNYFFQKNNQKLQLAYAWMEHIKGGSGSYVTDMGIDKGRMLSVCFQMGI